MKTQKLNQPTALALATLLLLVWSPNLAAQNGYDWWSMARDWVALDAPPGWEHLATDSIMKTMPGWKRDALGNLILRKGSGSPRRVVACGLDRPAFAVTEITDDGYLRLREMGGGRSHPLWIQFHEGQRVRVFTRGGVVPGVAIVKSTHLQRGGRGVTVPPATLDDLWVDVGATSRDDVRRLGIEMLNPVVRTTEPWAFDNFVSGQLASVRVGCAAIAHAAGKEVTSGETIFLIATLRSFGNDGLEAALRSLGRVDEVTVVDQNPGETRQFEGMIQRKVEKPAYLPESTGLTAVNLLALDVRSPGSLVETVNLRDATELLKAIEKAAAVRPLQTSYQMIRGHVTEREQPRDAASPVAELLKKLADVPGVSGHEGEVREAIRSALPAWAQKLARVDNEGNLIVEVGPDRDATMFIAHQDEVGFEVTEILSDGTLLIRPRGGLYLSLWEGGPALLHLGGGKAPLRGVFVPRDRATSRNPEALTAWFGLDGDRLKELGVTVGSPITAFKDATRLGANRFTARALDDRAGSTALILAARRITPATLKRKVIFAWAVREETGLEGAIALAKQYGASVKRVYSVDTFVSSDSPLETTRFAHAPLGRGAVIRGLDNSAVAPPLEVERILRIARAQNIQLQVGATNGGTDGSDFVRYGALHVSLSWPGRYSHSPVEVLDLRDLQALERLIYAIAIEP